MSFIRVVDRTWERGCLQVCGHLISSRTTGEILPSSSTLKCTYIPRMWWGPRGSFPCYGCWWDQSCADGYSCFQFKSIATIPCPVTQHSTPLSLSLSSSDSTFFYAFSVMFSEPWWIPRIFLLPSYSEPSGNSCKWLFKCLKCLY